MEAYPIPPEQWAETPIKREINPLTADEKHPEGYREGEDKGYRKIATLKDVTEPLVEPAGVRTRPSYDGFNEYGDEKNESIALAGGLENGELVVREGVARALDHAQQILDDVFGGEFNIVALDGFRSRDRQAAGFTRIMKEVLAGNENPSITEMYDAGMTADGTFAWVNADTDSAEYAAIASELMATAKEEIEAIAARKGEVTSEVVEELIYEIITISANSKVGPAAGRGVPLIFENNAHAGGGAVDMMFTDRTGKLINKVPFDFVGPEAGMDYMEDYANFEKFLATARGKGTLKKHLERMGFASPEAFTQKDWEMIRNALRIRYHLMKAVGATYYSAHDSNDGGEDWHIEPGNVTFGLNGKVVSQTESASRVFDSGNPGHALQKHGRQATAVWGGSTAHIIARRDFGLKM